MTAKSSYMNLEASFCCAAGSEGSEESRRVPWMPRKRARSRSAKDDEYGLTSRVNGNCTCVWIFCPRANRLTCVTRVRGNVRTLICFVFFDLLSPQDGHRNDEPPPEFKSSLNRSGRMNFAKHCSRVTALGKLREPPLGTSRESPTVSSNAVLTTWHDPHVTSDRSVPANARCMGHGHLVMSVSFSFVCVSV